MITNRRLTLIPVLVLLSVAVCLGQIDELKSKAILVRSPDTDKACTENDQGMAVSVGNEDVSIQLGDRFQIITHRSGVMNTEVIEKCKPSTYFEQGLLLFRAADFIDWEGSFDALLAIKRGNIQPDQVGSVSGILINRVHRAAVLKALKGQVPPTDTILVEYGAIVVPPNSTRLFLFVLAQHHDRQNFDDRSIVPVGLLFEIRGEELSCLVSETDLENIYSISDVDGDGIWEMLAQFGNWGGGTYELRFFDGIKFTNDKLELYDWSH